MAHVIEKLHKSPTMSQDALEKIEILSLDLFDTHKEEIGIIEQIQKHFLNTDLGWHYYLDLAWIIRDVRNTLPRGSLILDAGAGSGLLQFILSELGYNVISADFVDRGIPAETKKRYGRVTHYLNSRKKTFVNRYTRHLNAAYVGGTVSRLKTLLRSNEGSRAPVALIEKNRFIPKAPPCPLLEGEATDSCGRIFFYTCDLKDMPLLPDGFVDGVVSVSALEHNEHADFENCIDEILRVTKQTGRIAVTVSASNSDDWFHEPSNGWCYSEATIKKLFHLPEGITSNFSQKDVYLDALKKEGNELHKRLSPVYYKSGANGMPWGKWDPQYQPVGVVKVKK